MSVPRALQSALRREALAIKEERSRGHVPLRVWAGTPGKDPSARVVGFSPDDALDQHDRLEVVLSLTHAVAEDVAAPMLWLTRSGGPDPCPADLCWLRAAAWGFTELGLVPSFALVTREGWSLHPSGTVRRWRRLRE